MKKANQITHLDFKAYLPNGSLHPDIIKAFLVKQKLSAFDIQAKEIEISDYRGLQLIVDPQIIETLKRQPDVDCLISVQFRKQGHFAIAVPLKGKGEKE